MNVGDERSQSFWMDDAGPIEAPRLSSDESCDIVVIGAGIAGLSTAYELSRFGRSVVVIDRGKIGYGMTARTTAHLAPELDDRYSELIRVRSEEEARLYYDSQVAAVNRVEAICRDEQIDADFARLDGFLFAAQEDHRAELDEEYRACRKVGVDIEWVDGAPIPGLDTGKALRFPNQGRFHPAKYLAGLARVIRSHGGRIYADTPYVSHEEGDRGVELKTEQGSMIRAGSAVFATNSPVNNVGPSDVGSVDEIAPGEGAILREGLTRVACYKAGDGTVVRRSAACTHMGCLVHWNPFEKCWDCPCHGSHFAPDGEVLNGPALSPLAAVSEEPVARAKQSGGREPQPAGGRAAKETTGVRDKR